MWCHLVSMIVRHKSSGGPKPWGRQMIYGGQSLTKDGTTFCHPTNWYAPLVFKSDNKGRL